MNQKIEKVFIGLDIGTESVGYAMTDENYNILTVGGKACMGVRLFDEAHPAEERRVFRANKVRRNREKFRLTLLQELFWKEIEKVDPLFFIRLKASSFWKEDKKKANAELNSLDSLFAGKLYADKDHFDKFETVYHLRDFLIKESSWAQSAPDIRYVYLACHHILKARGHFLFDSDDFAFNEAGKQLFEELNNYMLAENEESGEDELPSPAIFALDRFGEVEEIAKTSGLKLNKKKEELQKAFGLGKNKYATDIIKAFLGFNMKIKDIVPDYEDTGELNKFSFNSDWDALAPELARALGDNFLLVVILKKIYDWFMLEGLLKGKTEISEVMIDKYNKHKKDLKDLKALVKEKAEDKYYKIFRSANQSHNYAAYIGSTLIGGGCKTIVNRANEKDRVEKPELYAFLKKELKDVLTEEMLTDMENGTFLSKLRTKDNSVYPNQLHKDELKKILANASKFYDIDSAKILSLATFRVPYYVGRLNGYYKNRPKDNAHHVWIEKRKEYQNSRTRITPWNFDEIVDLDESREAFITRVLSKCSYLKDQTVLPKNSIIYSKFTVLNELNNLKINGVPISIELKQRVYRELFETQKNITLTKLLNFLGNGIEKEAISGIDKEGKGFNSSLSSYLQAKEIFGENIKKKDVEKIFEDVVLWHAIFNDKKQVESKIKKHYGELDTEIVKRLKGLNFSGFGKLSERLLVTHCARCPQTGAKVSIMDLLWTTNENFMQIINNPHYRIKEWLAAENCVDDGKVGYRDVRNSYASPPVKRAVWQAMLIVDELVKLAGRQPDKIFVEVIRSGLSEKERTRSRREQIIKQWASAPDFDKSYPALKGELAQKSDDALRGEKLYLYFLQCGKCAYSGEAINISDLSNDNLYDVDHIIPQSWRTDNALTNKVLAKKVLNQAKDNKYPLNRTPAIWDKRTALLPMWKTWLTYGLISNEKYQRLSRTAPVDDKELEGFIARQLVFTGQSATVAATLFKQKYGESEIVYSKAAKVSMFRDKFDLLKCREANDLHHAHDAYLNIVVGNTYNQRFNHNKDFYKRKFENEAYKAYSEAKLFSEDVDGAWKKDASIEIVRKSLKRNFLPVSKKTQETSGAFYKQTIWPAPIHQKEIHSGQKQVADNSADNLIPRKGSKNNPLANRLKYGGYKTRIVAYLMIVEHSVNQKRLREFVPVHILDKKQWEAMTPEAQTAQLSEKFVLPKIIVPKIPMYTLFKIDAMEFRISGQSNGKAKFHNAKQFFFDKTTSDYIRIISKYNERVKEKKLNPENFADADEIVVSGTDKKNSKILKLSKVDNIELWNALLKKIDNLYGKVPKELRNIGLGIPDIYDKLAECSEDFIRLSVPRQIKVLTGVIVGLGCNAKFFDLSELGKGSSTAIIQPLSKITYPLVMVNQSVTGLKEKHTIIYPFENNGEEF